MIKPIHLLSAIGILMSSLAMHASNPVTYDTSKWTIHSAFENQPRKILDTPDATYFLVHQHLYSANPSEFNGNFSSPTGGVFIFDKKNPDATLKDYANIAHFSGFDIQLINYNPVTGEIVIAYGDGGIDFINADNQVIYIDEIKKRVLPGASEINAINFDPVNGDTWISTKRGFVHFDAVTHEVLHSPQWDDAVSDIVPVGDYIVAVVGSKLLAAPKSTNLALRESYKDVPVTGAANIGSVAYIMSLGNKAFATINTSGLLHTFHLEDFVWSATHEANTAAGAQFTQQFWEGGNRNVQLGNYSVNNLDHTVTPTETGFYIGSSQKAYFINRPLASDGKATVYSIPLPAESSSYHASYDTKNFWFYADARSFVSRFYDADSNSWSDIKLSPEINAPLTSRDNYFLYSPSQGLVMVNRHSQKLEDFTTQYKSAMVATYKDGKWENKTPMYNYPYVGDKISDALGTAIWHSFCNKWPVANPVGAVIDPVNPNVLHMGSLWEGIASVYLDDPRKNPHKVVNEEERGLSFFNAYPFLTNLRPGKNYWVDPIMAIGCDADDVLWFYYDYSQSHSITSQPGIGSDLVFYYTTADGRRNQILDPDPQKTPQHFDWKKLTVPAELVPGWWNAAVPLKYGSNKNKIIHTNFSEDYGEGKVIRIFDHNGTLEDTSDDKVTKIKYFRLPNGSTYQPTSIYDIKENPINGDIALTGFINTFIINLNDPVVDGVIDARVITYTGENGQEVEFRPSSRANYSIYDEFGRLWIATYMNGVIGVSADGKSIIANFNSQNSPIGSNDVRGIGWNPETKSLFISTYETVCEVRVDDPASTGASGEASIDAPCSVPENVMPEFGGMVAFHNIPNGVALRIRDSKGNTVRELESTFTGIAHWDLLDTEGKLVKSDRYTVTDASGNNTFDPIILPVIR